MCASMSGFSNSSTFLKFCHCFCPHFQVGPQACVELACCLVSAPYIWAYILLTKIIVFFHTLQSNHSSYLLSLLGVWLKNCLVVCCCICFTPFPPPTCCRSDQEALHLTLPCGCNVVHSHLLQCMFAQRPALPIG